MGRNNNRRLNLPDLDSSLDKIIKAEGPVRNKIPYHHDIYDAVNSAIDRYKGDGTTEGSGNDNDFKRSIYFGVYNSIMALLHAKDGDAQKSLGAFKEDTLKSQHRKTMDIRLHYEDALVVAAYLSTKGEKGVGFEYSHLVAWKDARKAIASACKIFEGTGKRSDPRIQAKLGAAYETLEDLRKRAFKAYDRGIPR